MGVMLEHGQPQRTASSENRMPQMGGRGSAPPSRAAPPHGTARVVPAAGNRRPNSFREAGHAVMKGGGVGITLSESIRNSGAALEEHEKQIRTLNTAMDGLRGQLESKDRDLQKLTATMNERVEGKDKQIEELRDNARASEMAIRGLEDEIRLLRKQNNEIDRAGRHGRNTNQPDRASPTSDAEAQKKLDAAEQQARQLKGQLARAEEEAGALKKKVVALEAQLGVQRKDSKESDASGKALAAKLAALEKLVAEREKEIKALRAEIAALKTALAAAEQAAKSAGAGKAGADEVKDLCAKLKVAEERLAASVRDKEKVSADLDTARKQAETHKAAAAAAVQSVATLEAEMKALLAKLQKAEAEAAEARGELGRKQSELEGLQLRGRKQAEDLEMRDGKIVALEQAVKDLQGKLGEVRSAVLERELEEWRRRCGEAEDACQTHKLSATEAQAMCTLAKNKADTLERELAESRAGAARLEARVKELEKADSEALARLCRVRELEAEALAAASKLAQVEAERDSAQSSCSLFEKQLSAVKKAAEAEAQLRSKLKAECDEARTRAMGLERELEELRKRPTAAAAVDPDVQGKLEELDNLKSRAAIQAQVHKLQMLLRMAEITKLEEHIKCSRRSDSVKEEKLGLLTYNLASAESQIAQENAEAGQKRQAVREERMGVLNKKQKGEEDKMRTNEDSYNTQSKRLKEKLRELEAQLKALP